MGINPKHTSKKVLLEKSRKRNKIDLVCTLSSVAGRGQPVVGEQLEERWLSCSRWGGGLT